MPHFFINSKDVNNDKIVISDKDNYQHIAKSLRIKKGENLLLIDENQIQYETVVVEVTSKEVTVHIENSYKSNRNLNFGLYLAQSPLRSDAQSIVIEKATELGTKGVYPIITDNCAINKIIVEKKIPKWQKIMYEASKQCERAAVPTCFEMSSLKDLCSSNKFDKIIAFCERRTDLTLKQFVAYNPIMPDENILIIIGPEGGFSDDEFKLFEDNEIPMLTLGNLILKAETAVIVALGNIIYEFNNYRKN